MVRVTPPLRIVCAWCGIPHVIGDTAPVEPRPLDSHGMCPEAAAKVKK